MLGWRRKYIMNRNIIGHNSGKHITMLPHWLKYDPLSLNIDLPKTFRKVDIEWQRQMWKHNIIGQQVNHATSYNTGKHITMPPRGERKGQGKEKKSKMKEIEERFEVRSKASLLMDPLEVGTVLRWHQNMMLDNSAPIRAASMKNLKMADLCQVVREGWVLR